MEETEKLYINNMEKNVMKNYKFENDEITVIKAALKIMSWDHYIDVAKAVIENATDTKDMTNEEVKVYLSRLRGTIDGMNRID